MLVNVSTVWASACPWNGFPSRALTQPLFKRYVPVKPHCR
jgi:hypothetical protein